MDMNETISQQLASNPQFTNQLYQLMQQNGMIPANQPNQQTPKPLMNWNVPTNPMAAVWWNGMMNAMNNMQNNNQQNVQNNQNQPQQQPTSQNDQKTDDIIMPIRVVKSPDDIKVEQLPVDDEIKLFIQDDMSVIYGKRWTNNGTIENLRFVLVPASEDNNTNESNNGVASNQGINIEELMAAIDNKLKQFKKEFTADIKGQTKNKNNGRAGEVDGK